MPWVPRLDGRGSHNMREYYDQVLVPFGVTLTDMERRGIKVNAKDYLAGIEVRAKVDKEKYLNEFMEWMVSVAGADARWFNPQSAAQMQTLFFGGAQNQKKKDESLPKERVVKVRREGSCSSFRRDACRHTLRAGACVRWSCPPRRCWSSRRSRRTSWTFREPCTS